MLRMARNLFGLAALALVAIAATLGAMYVLHDATSNWIAESRNISRVARTAYVVALERELALTDASTKETKGSQSAIARSTTRLAQLIDSLAQGARRSPERSARMDAIEVANRHWIESDISVRGRDRSLARERFEELRATLSRLMRAEEILYNSRQKRENLIRLIFAAAVMIELLGLLLVLNSIRSRGSRK